MTDAEVIRLLEFPKVRRIVGGYTTTDPGAQCVEAIEPVDDAAAIAQALQQTSQMRKAIVAGLALNLGEVRDVRKEVERAAAGGGPLETVVLNHIADSLEAGCRVAKALQRLGSGFPVLVSLALTIPRCGELAGRIRACIDASGRIKDEASPVLARLRRRIRAVRSQIEKRLDRLINHSHVQEFLQYPKPTICRERYVLPVNANFRREVPGVVHGSSDSGATLYIEPRQIVDQANELSELADQAQEEETRILMDLSEAVGARCEEVSSVVAKLAQVDAVRAMARMSLDYAMTEPNVTGERTLELKEARHPLLLRLTTEEGRREPDFAAVVPVDVHLGDDYDVLVVTGPNTGGKTVCLKTVGLICLMARAGMHVPAAHATVPLYDRIFADIGDEQSIEYSLSTFSSHMSRIIGVLQRAGPRSLVLLDELGAGTDPAEGGALGLAILEELAELGASCVVTTHIGELKTFASGTPRVENACVEFDSVSLQPTYRLMVGKPGDSNALLIAERLGLSPGLLQRANEHLAVESADLYSASLERVQRTRQDAERRRRRLARLESQAEKLRREHEDGLARLKEERERLNADLGLQMRDRIEQLARDAEALYDGVSHSHKRIGQRVRAIRDGLRNMLDQVSLLLEGHRIERPLRPGDRVYVPKVNRWGELARVDRRRQRALVRVGGMDMELDLGELVPWGETGSAGEND